MVAVADAAATVRLRAEPAPGAGSDEIEPGNTMDAILEIGKAIIAVGGILLLLVAIPFLFMTIFSIATGIDERLNR